ncbi:MAG: hypothetical protein V4722_22530 [Bacteroidota bacterium]
MNYWPLDTSSVIDSKVSTGTYDHLFDIGDCFVFSNDNRNFYGLMLYKISKDADGINYDFIIQPNAYTSVPDWNLFKSRPFLGHAIPNGITYKREVGFMLYGFMEEDFKKIYSNLKLVGHVNLAATENRNGGQSVPATFTQLEQSISGIQKKLSQKTSGNFLEGPSDTVFSFTVLKTTELVSEKKKPYIIWILSKKTAHPIAVQLLAEDYWWQEADDFSPFGNDDGSDALHGFREWRLDNATKEPAEYFDDLANSWGTSFQQKDWTDYERTRKENKYNILYNSIDYAIIGTAFAQLILEGKISAALKAYGIKAINRQILLTEKGDISYTSGLKEERLLSFSMQLSMLKKAP